MFFLAALSFYPCCIIHLNLRFIKTNVPAAREILATGTLDIGLGALLAPQFIKSERLSE